MDDPRLSRQLQALEEPVAADPAFLDALFERLVEEARFQRAEGSPETAADVGARTAGHRSSRRLRRWVPPVLVAALVVGGSLAVAAGFGGFIQRGASVPNLCELVAPAEISAIIGAPVTLERTDEYDSGDPATAGRTCTYSYPQAVPGARVRGLGISILRSADPVADWAQLQSGPGAVAIEGLGDAATLFPVAVGSVVRTLFVLKGPYVISVFHSVGGGQSVPPQQLEDIARLLLARL